MDEWTFETKSLDYETIEMEICDFCGIGSPQSSNLDQRIEANKRAQEARVYASNGSAVCSVSAVKKPKSDIYVVSIVKKSVKKKR